MAENDVTFNRVPEGAHKRWKIVRDVCAGDQALRTEEYLPYLNKADMSAENKARNVTYRLRAVFYEATGFTEKGLIGLAFKQEPTTALPDKLKYLLKDADGAGVNIFQQSQSSLADVLETGRHGIYVDFSSALKRPVIKTYLSVDIINWRTSLVGGKTVLSMVVLHEEAEVDSGYSVTAVDQWRELYLEGDVCHCRLWQREDNDVTKPPIIVQVENEQGQMVDDLILRSSAAVLDFIPFGFIGSQNNDTSIDDAPLYGLAMLNVAHFRNSADYEDSVFYAGQAQPWMSGLTTEWRDWLVAKGMYIGSRAPMMLPENGMFGFAQPLPNTLVKEAMDQKESQMVALGARLIQPVQASKTATQAGGEREASTSVLAMCVSNVSEAYETAMHWCARYLDLHVTDEDIQFDIDQDFTTTVANPQVMQTVVDAWQKGAIAKPDVRDLLRAHGAVAADRTDEMIDADLAKEPKPAPPVALPIAAVPAATA